MHRRTLLAAPAALTAAAIAAGCQPREDAGVTGDEDEQSDERSEYGANPSQFGGLYLPDGGPAAGVVVVLHGGFWRSEYDLQLGAPLAQDLARRGWAAWNLEYRRVGNGGGVPETLLDVSAGIDHLRTLEIDFGDGRSLGDVPVVALGHSAGGHLAAWAAGTGRNEVVGADVGVPLTHVVSQAGVLDLRAADEEGLGGGAVSQFLGHAAGAADRDVDPAQQVPLDVPVWCVHGRDDDIVPPSQSADYVAAATAAGASAELVEVPGDHFAVIDVDSEAWAATVEILDGIAG